MAGAGTFAVYCEEAARRFLQTVVIIDNEAFYPSNVRKDKNEGQSYKNKKVLNKPPVGMRGAAKAEKQNKETSREYQSGNDNAKARQMNKLVKPKADELPENKENDSHELNAKVITEKFADEQITCSVYCPHDDEDPIERSVKLARNADIVVVDWDLDAEGGDKSKKARKIISHIVKHDIENGGRLRMIAIYTAEGELDDLVDQLETTLAKIEKNAPKLEKKKNVQFSLSNNQLKIIFLCKEKTPNLMQGVQTVAFEDLPQKLITEFSHFTKGLLPTISMHAIASVRETAHHILAKFHSGLDGTLAGHRCLLTEPGDVECYCEDLFVAEIENVIALNKVGSRYANLEIFKKWLRTKVCENGRLPKNGHTFLTLEQIDILLENGDKNKGHGNAMMAARMNWVKECRQNGKDIKDKKGNILSDEEICSINKCEVFDRMIYIKKPPIGIKGVPGLFYESDEDTQKANFEFARISMLKREYYGNNFRINDWQPRLTLGSIVRIEGNDDNFLLCVQARCDSVRLDGPLCFPFLRLANGKNSNLDMVLRLADGTDKALKICNKPYDLVVYKFKPDRARHIEAEETDNGYFFSAIADGEKGPIHFQWIADMKDFFAQRVVHQLAERIASVGLDEYEWLRRNSKQ